jgi:hypothetical protein
MEPPNPAEPVLAALYGDAVRFTDGTEPVEAATSRFAERPAVLFHRRCVAVFDFGLPLGCDWERAGERSALDDALAALSARPGVLRVMVAYLDGISGTYAFAVFSGGARVRRFAHVPDEGVVRGLDEGAPLATEEAGHPQARIDRAARALLEDRGLLALTYEPERPAFVCERRA